MYLNPILSGVQSIVGIILKNSGETFNTALLIFAIPIVAFGGDYSGALTFSCSYLADTIPEKDRTFRINLLNGAYSFASALFSLVSGFIILRLGYTGGFLISLIINVINVIYLALFVPDPRKDWKFGLVSSVKVTGQSKGQKSEKSKDQNDIPKTLDGPDEKNRSLQDTSQDFSVQSIDVALRSEENLGKSETKGKCEKIRDGESESVEDEQEKICQSMLSQPEMVEDDRVQNGTKSTGNHVVSMSTTTPVCNNNDSLPESFSHSRIKTVKVILKEANPYTNFKKLIQVVRAQNQSRASILPLISSFSSLLTWTGELTIIVLFVKNRPLNFNETDVGYFLAAQSIM